MANTEFPELGERPMNTASLTEQTPGLDKTRVARDTTMRGITWIRERPGVIAGVLGGLVVIGVGLYLGLRRRPMSRMARMKQRGLDWVDILKDKLAR